MVCVEILLVGDGTVGQGHDLEEEGGQVGEGCHALVLRCAEHHTLLQSCIPSLGHIEVPHLMHPNTTTGIRRPMGHSTVEPAQVWSVLKHNSFVHWGLENGVRSQCLRGQPLSLAG